MLAGLQGENLLAGREQHAFASSTSTKTTGRRTSVPVAGTSPPVYGHDTSPSRRYLILTDYA